MISMTIIYLNQFILSTLKIVVSIYTYVVYFFTQSTISIRKYKPSKSFICLYKKNLKNKTVLTRLRGLYYKLYEIFYARFN